MPKIYSHSRLSTFEQCPFKFKLRYIDEIIPESETTIEAHLGSVIHEVLENLYLQVKLKKIPTIDFLVSNYSEIWERNFTPKIKLIKKNFTIQDYFNKGIKFIIDYYLKHKPFDDGTLEVEKKINISLDSEYKIQGFIDRLVFNKNTKKYEIHDYKTANNLPSREKIESDRQLALYSIAIKELFNTKEDIMLIWHYLAHNTRIISTRTNEQLEQLKKETLELIKQIESTEKFQMQVSVLCDWCEYKSMCPAFGGKPLEKQSKLKTFEKNKNTEDKTELKKEIAEESVKPEGLDIWN